MLPDLSVREIELWDIDPLVDYWLSADETYLTAMGADIRKIPDKEDWVRMLKQQISQPYEKKESYCTIWLSDGEAIGHCNVNKIIFGEEAYMHLHLWHGKNRKLGAGTELVRKSIPFFFNNLKLKKLCCEPYALNPAPNRILEKTGFRFLKEYRTIPGYLNSEQNVKSWYMDLEQYRLKYGIL